MTVCLLSKHQVLRSRLSTVCPWKSGCDYNGMWIFDHAPCRIKRKRKRMGWGTDKSMHDYHVTSFPARNWVCYWILSISTYDHLLPAKYSGRERGNDEEREFFLQRFDLIQGQFKNIYSTSLFPSSPWYLCSLFSLFCLSTRSPPLLIPRVAATMSNYNASVLSSF